MNTCPGIVVIEDEEDLREVIAQFLEMEGYHVWAFANGKEAIDALDRCEAPCLILLDLMMPVMNGLEFLAQKQHMVSAIVAIPVFIVSAVSERAQDKPGVSGWIKKPIDLDLLMAVVEKHCGRPGRSSTQAS